ncbi:50S ribosomal protein L11 methyltransferase [Sphingosinicella sp. BN140058]|uniref:50S ribosomal protein L11 methyltransferase n=1 Tax=Sphingosinicella sp. BN140058 TaxID=1892855 RepID=UPI001010B67D|nr:50S ribosomal protein L11 methyltransferase [Sphingosinicella sp. BN140058]QAY77647.1 50S ribosomal protein L11 methyltransferase [Sphingosinicella sp. BN140058]
MSARKRAAAAPAANGETGSWKATLPCNKAEAEQLQEEIGALALLDEPPVLMTSEPDPAQPDVWRLDAYFAGPPSAEMLAMLKSLAPSAAGQEPLVEQVEERDWVTLSQQGLEPIRAGRFFVHTPAHRDSVPADSIAFEIDAGRAFGTGQHETTSGCLVALSKLKDQGISVSNLIDLGTGTGLLAFAAMRLWPAARAAASDIDPVSIEVTEENAGINAVRLGRIRGQLELAVAAGLEHPRLRQRAPYDLIIANILAGPLIELAPSVSKALEAGGRLILAGLLDSQADAVAAAYRRHGLMQSFRVEHGEWPTLVMRKRRSLGWR